MAVFQVNGSLNLDGRRVHAQREEDEKRRESGQMNGGWMRWKRERENEKERKKKKKKKECV